MVLLLDDDDAFREAFASMLRDDGYKVFECSNAQEVPSLDFLSRVTALIVDYELPGENGIAFADRFHRTYPDVPIAMVTAHQGRCLDAQLAARTHMTLWRKPVSYAELVATLPSPRV